MDREINFTYKPVENERARVDQIANIIGEGIFNFLKKNGYLKKQVDQDKVNQIMEKTKSILESNRISNLMEL